MFIIFSQYFQPENHVIERPVPPQLWKFKTVLTSSVKPKHKLFLWTKKIDWDSLKKYFAPLFGEAGRPYNRSHHIRNNRMLRNYLIGTAGDKINTLLAATAYNMRKWMSLKSEEILNLILSCIFPGLILAPSITGS
jgi:hypothetical protein